MRLHVTSSSGRSGWRPGRWDVGADFELGDVARLELVAATGVGLSRARLSAGLEVVPRQEGAVFRPAGHSHQRELRKWLQEHGVLPWRRAALPCVCVGAEIVAIGLTWPTGVDWPLRRTSRRGASSGMAGPR